MTYPLRTLCFVAAFWLSACGASLAASTPQTTGTTQTVAASSTVTDEMLAPLESAYMRAVKPGEQAELHRELIGTVLRRVQRSYAREIDVPGLVSAAVKILTPLEPGSAEPADAFKKAINAALASLDPYSRYLDADAQITYRSAISGSFGGLGLEVEMVDGLVRVVAPVAGAPAARAGLQHGDLIVRFDDQPVAGMALSDAIARIRGQAGTPISLTIRRPGRADDFTVSVVRENIRTEPLRARMHGEVLVLRLASFTSSVAAGVEKAIEEATAKASPRAVILDMRGNGGGLFRQAVLIADLFLNRGEIVSLRGRTSGNQRSWHADSAERLGGVPMVVLLDGRSASASELVAAALQENGRAIVMGQRSFGKGSVQSLISLGGDKGALRLTTAVYIGPSGRSVQRTGVGPDIELIAEASAPGRPARREADRTQALPGADEPPPPRARVEQSRCAAPRRDTDPALTCALAYLRAGEVDSFVAALDPVESR